MAKDTCVDVACWHRPWPGWPDSDIFRQLCDYFLWAVLFNITKGAQLCKCTFHRKAMFVFILTRNWLGYTLGELFTNSYIWPPCENKVQGSCLITCIRCWQFENPNTFLTFEFLKLKNPSRLELKFLRQVKLKAEWGCCGVSMILKELSRQIISADLFLSFQRTTEHTKTQRKKYLKFLSKTVLT
jgi:hypothetical protein